MPYIFFLARLFLKKKSRYCHHSGVVGVSVVVVGGVGVVTNLKPWL